MQKILVVGATGQIGSELTMALRKKYGNANVIAAGHITKPDKILLESGPFDFVDCLKIDTIAQTVKKHGVDTIFHLAAILSAVAEENLSLPGI